MASRDPIPDDPGRPAPILPRRPHGDGSHPERTPRRLEFRLPPTTVERDIDVGSWIAIAAILGLIVVGILFLTGVL